MRVNVYAEELTDRIEIISKDIDGQRFTGLRIYLYLPVTDASGSGQHRGPFLHRSGDDDSAAVTFWGKRDLRTVLLKAIKALDVHYALARPAAPVCAGQRCDTCGATVDVLHISCPECGHRL